MSWFDHQETPQKSGKVVETKDLKIIEILMPGGTEFVPLSKYQVKRVYADDLGGALLIIVDEVAELLLPSGVKTEAGKEEDAMKQECVNLIQSITQLGRAAGIHMVLCTQRNDAKIIPGVIQNNPLNLNTKLRVLRKIN